MADFELTLNPTPETNPAPAAAAAQAVPAVPALTLTPEAPATAMAAAPVQEADPMAGYRADYEKLSEAERKAVDDFSGKIDIADSQQVMQYGVAAQKNIASFSEQALDQVRTKDLGEVGQALSGLVVQLQSIGTKEEKRGFFGRKIQQVKADLETMKSQYAKAEVNVDRIVHILEGHQIALLKDIAMLDEMYKLNEQYYKELTMYILAGKQRVEELKRTKLVELREQAERTGSQEDAQAYNDFCNLIDRFEKKLYDLEVSRMVSIQMGPQTRLLQNNDTVMVQKIQSSLVNTIPLWKSQMVVAMGLERARQATEATSAVTDMTNKLLTQNADMLKMGTVAAAREAERSVVDLETLQHTNQQLISSLDEVMKIQQEGREKRRAAEVELARIEGELKAKLRELRT